MYLVSNSPVFWGIIVGIFIISFLVKRFIPKDKKTVIKVCHIINQVMFYLIAIEMFYVVLSKILNSLS